MNNLDIFIPDQNQIGHQESGLQNSNHQGENPFTNPKVKGFTALSGAAILAGVGGTATAATLGAFSKISVIATVGKGIAVAGKAIVGAASGPIAAAVVVGALTLTGVVFLLVYAAKKVKEAKMNNVLNKQPIEKNDIPFIQKNSEIAGKIISKISENNLDAAANILDKMTDENDEAAANILAKMSDENDKAAVNILAKMHEKNDEAAVNILAKMSKENDEAAVNILAKMSKENDVAAYNILAKMFDGDAKNNASSLMRGMFIPHPKKTGKIIANIYNNNNARELVSIVSEFYKVLHFDRRHTSRVVSEIYKANANVAVNILAKVFQDNPESECDILFNMDSKAAGYIVSNIYNKKHATASDIVSNIYKKMPKKAGEIVSNMDSAAAYHIVYNLFKVKPEVAGNIVSNMDSAAANNILYNINPKVVCSIASKMNLKGIGKIKGVLSQIYNDKRVALVNILYNISPKVAAKIALVIDESSLLSQLKKSPLYLKNLTHISLNKYECPVQYQDIDFKHCIFYETHNSISDNKFTIYDNSDGQTLEYFKENKGMWRENISDKLIVPSDMFLALFDMDKMDFHNDGQIRVQMPKIDEVIFNNEIPEIDEMIFNNEIPEMDVSSNVDKINKLNVDKINKLTTELGDNEKNAAYNLKLERYPNKKFSSYYQAIAKFILGLEKCSEENAIKIIDNIYKMDPDAAETVASLSYL